MSPVPSRTSEPGSGTSVKKFALPPPLLILISLQPATIGEQFAMLVTPVVFVNEFWRLSVIEGAMKKPGCKASGTKVADTAAPGVTLLGPENTSVTKSAQSPPQPVRIEPEARWICVSP